jgi:MAF protein
VERLILASSSPRRFELMKITGLPFEVARPDIDETPRPGEPGSDYVMRLSLEKARSIADHAQGDALILSADTTVVDGSQILGKPDSADEATAMLRQLRQRPHVVHTGVTLIDTASGQSATTLTTTHVFMRPYTDEEIAAYVASGDPIGKAGSYAIQNTIFHPVNRLEGCYANVVGLPMCTVYAMLGQFGVCPPVSVTCSPTHPPCVFSV